MIKLMMVDVILFLLLLTVFLLSYGIAAQVLLYPNAEPSWKILVNILYEPYFSIYGNANLDEFTGDVPGCSRNATIYDDPSNGATRCPQKSWLALVMYAVYILVTNILLINLLIAMFSFTFNKIQVNSERTWRFYRFGLIHEFYNKPVLPPPLVIFIQLWRLKNYICGLGCLASCQKSNNDDDFRKKLEDEEHRRLTAFEREGMENYLNRQRVSTAVGERVDMISGDEKQISTNSSLTTDTTIPNEQQLMMELRESARQLIGSQRRSRLAPDPLDRLAGIEYQLNEQRSQLMAMLRTLTIGRDHKLPKHSVNGTEVQDVD
jgi:transient receptor potential cation channel subfamily M protein 2